jgi:hypothetical protein
MEKLIIYINLQFDFVSTVISFLSDLYLYIDFYDNLMNLLALLESTYSLLGKSLSTYETQILLQVFIKLLHHNKFDINEEILKLIEKLGNIFLLYESDPTILIEIFQIIFNLISNKKLEAEKEFLKNILESIKTCYIS